MSIFTKVERHAQVGTMCSFSLETCYKCHMPFYMPTEVMQHLIKNKGESFWCPNGHEQHYLGETEEAKLKRQLQSQILETEKQRRAAEELSNDLFDATFRAEQEKKKRKRAEKKLLRVYNGVCPCCNRNFKNLHSHMQSKHPGKLGSTIKKAEKLHVKITNKNLKK